MTLLVAASGQRRRPRSVAVGRLVLLDGDGQTGEVGSTLTNPLRVRLTNRDGDPIAGQTIQWAGDADGQIIPPSITDGSGIATAAITLGTRAGSNTVTASLAGALGSPVGFSMTATPGALADLVIVAGEGQTGPASGLLPVPLRVQAVDGFGNGRSGESVVFAPAAGAVSVSPVVTDADGYAETAWTLGAGVGEQTLDATVGAIPVKTFHASATAADVVALNYVDGISLDTVAGTNSDLMHWRVVDGGGVGVQGVRVDFTAQGGGTPHALVAFTDADGLVENYLEPTGAIVGLNTLTAFVTATNGNVLSSGTTILTIPGPATQLSLTLQPSNTADSGQAFQQQPQVQLRDANGNAVAQSGVVVTGAKASGPDTLSPSPWQATTDSQGRGTFTGGALTGSGTNTIQFTASGLTPVTSNPISVIPPLASQLLFFQQPTTVVAGLAINPAPSVDVCDPQGVKVPGATNQVDILLIDNEEGAVLSGVLSQPAVNGRAVFPGLSPDLVGAYRLRATASGLTLAESVPFDAVAGGAYPFKPAHIVIRTDRDFLSHTEGGTWGDDGDARFKIVTPNGVGGDGIADAMALLTSRLTTSTGRAQYNPGHSPGTAPIRTGYTLSPTREELYVWFNFALSDPYNTHAASNLNKIGFFTCSNAAAAGAPMYCGIVGAPSQSAYQFQMRVQNGPPNKGGNGSSGARNIPCGGQIITRGERHEIVFYAKLNSVDGSGNGVADGLLDVWVDGVQRQSLANLCWRGNDAGNGPKANGKWQNARWEPTFGGSGGTGPGITQWMYMFDFAVGTE